MKPADRTGYNSGCPYCSNKKVAISNCLTTTHPELAKQWHPTKNGKLTPQDVYAGSFKKIWWKCDKGDDHEYEMLLSDRKRGYNCPICRGLKVVGGRHRVETGGITNSANTNRLLV